MGVCYGTPDFPTPSFTGHLKSAIFSVFSVSFSAFGDGKILAEPNLTVFRFAELKEATEDFRADALVGEGGFCYVYKGMLQGKQRSGRTKTIIAVKTLNPHGFQGHREWETEIQLLGRMSHPNLVKLLGYSKEDGKLALVYEFTPKGSLNNHLFRKGSTAHLPWDVRLKIVVGAARGLAFLHNSCKMIHRDFNTSNILLDGSYTARLQVFGLVKSGPLEGESHVSTCVVGTYGYAAPEYIATGHLYVKSDVYSFGVTTLSSKRKLKTIMDSRLEDDYSMDSAFQIAQLALKCLQRTPYKRPSMTEVVEELESIEAASAK
ncbi:hypothetical protein EUGRSUZ_H04300 [Eucalyptus grandis]|uniref:Uncharacterized protein n=2 Tax=Eucalyptus grandis TaxID=71139 RepID=A0ACC3JXK6_EUCGR|nr:hypothetical protein EUGRSUZ_H04300 [Eucalyptus grandis]